MGTSRRTTDSRLGAQRTRACAGVYAARARPAPGDVSTTTPDTRMTTSIACDFGVPRAPYANSTRDFRSQRRAVTPRCALHERANVLSKRAGDERTGHPIGDDRGWPP